MPATKATRKRKAKTAPSLEKRAGEALMSTAQLLGATGYHGAAITDLKALGVIKPAAVGKWPMLKTLGAIIHRLREKDAGNADRQRKNKAEADEAELRAMGQRKETAMRATVKQWLADIITTQRREIERADFLTPTQKTKLLTKLAKTKPPTLEAFEE